MEGVHLLYLGGALGGATVGLYQNGGYDEPLQMRLVRPAQRSRHERPICSLTHRHMIYSRVLWTFEPLSRAMLRRSFCCHETSKKVLKMPRNKGIPRDLPHLAVSWNPFFRVLTIAS